MKTYLFDIGHPAHVHYFKDCINILKKENRVIVVARDKDMTFDLLYKFQIDFISRGKGASGLMLKLLYLIYAVLKIVYVSRFVKVDRIIGFGSPYAAIASRLVRADNIIFTDTEHAHLTFKLYKPFADHIVTNKFYNRQIKNTRVSRLSGFFEQIYLSDIPNIYNNHEKKKVLFRFVDWDVAHHDIGYSGINNDQLINLVNNISLLADVYISSETTIPECLRKYKVDMASDSMHEFMRSLDLYIGESLTMGVESCLLGVPSIVVSKTAHLLGNATAMVEEYNIMKIENNIEEIQKQARLILQNSANYRVISKKIWQDSKDVKTEIFNIISL